MCFDNLTFPSTSSSWIDCLPSDKHSSYYCTIVSYISISWLKYESFNFIASISYSYLIIVLFSSPRWSHSLLFVCLAFSGSESPTLPSSLSFACVFRALFSISGTFRLSILSLKSPAITVTICKMASVKIRQFLLVFLGNELF